MKFFKASDVSEFAAFLKHLNKICSELYKSAEWQPPSLDDLCVGQLVMIRSPVYNLSDSSSDDDNDDNNNDGNDDEDELHVKWRRGRIKTIDAENERLSVYLLDDAHEWQKTECHQIIPVDKLPANHRFMQIEPQARLCRLKDSLPTTATSSELVWSQDAIRYFKSLMNQVGLVVTSCVKLDTQTSDVDYDCIYEVEIRVRYDGILKLLFLRFRET